MPKNPRVPLAVSTSARRPAIPGIKNVAEPYRQILNAMKTNIEINNGMIGNVDIDIAGTKSDILQAVREILVGYMPTPKPGVPGITVPHTHSHGELTGLHVQDDHPWTLTIDGSRKLQNDWDVGTGKYIFIDGIKSRGLLVSSTGVFLNDNITLTTGIGNTILFNNLGGNIANINNSGLTLYGGKYIVTDEVRARDGDGLYLRDDSGTLGIFIEDGGAVGIGIDTPTEALEVFPDTDVSAIIGKLHVGDVSTYSGYTGIAHVDFANATDYCLLQGPDGKTWLNAPSGSSVTILNASNLVVTIDYTGLALNTGKVLSADYMRLSASNVPATSTSTGTAGDFAYDSSYWYVCVSTDVWKRMALDLTSW